MSVIRTGLLNFAEYAIIIVLLFLAINTCMFFSSAADAIAVDIPVSADDYVNIRAQYDNRSEQIEINGEMYTYDGFVALYYAGHPDERMGAGHWKHVGGSGSRGSVPDTVSTGNEKHIPPYQYPPGWPEGYK